MTLVQVLQHGIPLLALYWLLQRTEWCFRRMEATLTARVSSPLANDVQQHIPSFFPDPQLNQRLKCLGRSVNPYTRRSSGCKGTINHDRAFHCYRALSKAPYDSSRFVRNLQQYAEASFCQQHHEYSKQARLIWHEELSDLFVRHWLHDSSDEWFAHLRHLSASTECIQTCRFCVLQHEHGPVMPGLFPIIGPESFCSQTYTDLYQLETAKIQFYFSNGSPRARREVADRFTLLRQAEQVSVSLSNVNFFPYPSRENRSILDCISLGLQLQVETKLRSGEQAMGHIYLYTHPGEARFVKIGVTKNLEQRLGSWKTTCRSDPILLGRTVDQVEHAKRLEALIHWQLRTMGHGRINRSCVHTKERSCNKYHEEWFQISTAEAFRVIEFWLDWSSYFRPHGPDHRLIVELVDQFEDNSISAEKFLAHWREVVPRRRHAGEHANWKTAKHVVTGIAWQKVRKTKRNIIQPADSMDIDGLSTVFTTVAGTVVRASEDLYPQTPPCRPRAAPPITPASKSSNSSPATSSNSTATVNSVGSAITDPGDYEIDTPSKSPRSRKPVPGQNLLEMT